MSKVLRTSQPHQDNLLHLNARHERSVDEANDRWHDISGNGHEAHGTAGGDTVDDSSFPEWEPHNGGRFIFTGSEAFNVPGPTSTSGQLTIESWFQRPSTTATMYLSDARNGTGTWHLTNYQDNNVNFDNDLRANDPETYQFDSNWWDRWVHLVATVSGSSSRLYINGAEITGPRLKENNGFSTGVGENFKMGTRYNKQSTLQGYMSVYRLYDMELSPRQAEVNYESEREYYQ